MASIRFDEFKKDRFRSTDGRFLVERTNKRHGQRFTIYDLTPGGEEPGREKIGSATTLGKTVNRVRAYLQERGEV